MQPRPSFDRSLLIAIAIGVISILGICWIFFASDRGESSIPATAIPSSIIPFEAPTPSPTALPNQDEPLPTATRTSPHAEPRLPTETLTSTATSTTESPPTPSATYTPNYIQPFPAGKYDDTNPNIAYDPYWTALKNPGTANAYLSTIHASTGVGNQASFRFTGAGFRLGYQRGKNFGTVTVLIDDEPYSFHEQAFDLVWRSPPLPRGDHFVQIIHQSGELINLDYIEILD